MARQWGSEAGLEGLLFAPWLTTGDLEAQIASETHAGTLGASQPSLVQFGVATVMRRYQVPSAFKPSNAESGRSG